MPELSLPQADLASYLAESLDELGLWLWQYDHASDLLEFSPGLVERLGGGFPPPGGASFAQWMARVHPADWQRLQSAIDGAVADDSLLDVEYRCLDVHGNWAWLRLRGHVRERDPQGGAYSAWVP